MALEGILGKGTREFPIGTTSLLELGHEFAVDAETSDCIYEALQG